MGVARSAPRHHNGLRRPGSLMTHLARSQRCHGGGFVPLGDIGLMFKEVRTDTTKDIGFRGQSGSISGHADDGFLTQSRHVQLRARRDLAEARNTVTASDPRTRSVRRYRLRCLAADDTETTYSCAKAVFRSAVKWLRSL